MKITIILPSLSSGGAERVMVLLSEGFLEKGHKITLITIAGKERDFYKLPTGVVRIALDIAGDSSNILEAIKNNFKRVLILRKAIKSTNPDIVISSLVSTNILTVLSLLESDIPILINEQNYTTKISKKKNWYKLRNFIYQYSDRLVSSSIGVDNTFKWLNSKKRVVSYNPLSRISEDDLTEKIDLDEDKISPRSNWITSMGRLTEQKGFDILIKAFYRISSNNPDWQLIIIGEGHLRSDLLELVNQYNLTEKVFLIGRLDNPFPIVKKSKFFVMASRFEGFGMVHAEALACGIPVISTDCPAGPNEVIRHDIDGILVENKNELELANAMDKLISNPSERQRLACNSHEVKNRFSLEKTVDKWENLIENLNINSNQKNTSSFN